MNAQEIVLQKSKEKLPTLLLDPVFREGYETDSHWQDGFVENPYPFPEGLAIEIMMISATPGQLSEEQKQRLSEANKLFKATEWSRWSQGNYNRWVLKI